MILPNVPEDVWGARPVLKSVREVAHHRCAGADAVLWSVLVMVAAHIPSRVAVETGIGTPVRPTLFAVIAGSSGSGKSLAWGVARALLPNAPEPWPLSTGEGAVEAFYGRVLVEQPQPPAADGEARAPKLVWTRQRIRDNALFFLDEGETLFRQLERPGNVVAPVLRSMWSGGTVGQANAGEENRRSLDAGTYTAGLVVGLQPDISGRLLADTATGTAQRFAWAASTDVHIPPGPVWGLAPSPTPLAWQAPALPDMPSPYSEFLTQPGPGRAWEPPPVLPPVSIMISPAIAHDIRAHQVAVRRGEVEPDEQDSQRTTMALKVAGVLAWIDGRLHIGPEDWQLAGALLATSDQVRAALLDHAETVTARERAERGVERAQINAATTQSEARRERVRKGVMDTLMERATQHARGTTEDASVPRAEFTRAFGKAARAELTDVLAEEVARGSIVEQRAHSGGSRYTLGSKE